MYWFLYDNGLRHERVNSYNENCLNASFESTEPKNTAPSWWKSRFLGKVGSPAGIYLLKDNSRNKD